MNAGEKDFVISKAATAGQITVSTAGFGRGTDFFCKDKTVQQNGGVHIFKPFCQRNKAKKFKYKDGPHAKARRALIK